MTRCRMDYKAVCITIFCACMFEEISFYNQSDNRKGEEGKVKTMVIRKVETPNYDSARLTRLMKFMHHSMSTDDVIHRDRIDA